MSYRVRRALREGVRLMKADEENFSQVWFGEWEYECTRHIPPERFAALFDPEDKNWRRQWLILGALGNYEDERFWDVFKLAYTEGLEDFIVEMGMWGMMNIDRLRFGLDNFFDALAQYAEMIFNKQGGQLTLF